LAGSCRRAADAGFDAIELLVPSGEEVDAGELRRLLGDHGLRLSALGTGAGFLRHRLHLSSPDAQVRSAALTFAGCIVDQAGELGAPAIVGSLKGSIEPAVDRSTALNWLSDGLQGLADRAARVGVPLILEPLNRYESNYLNR